MIFTNHMRFFRTYSRYAAAAISTAPPAIYGAVPAPPVPGSTNIARFGIHSGSAVLPAPVYISPKEMLYSIVTGFYVIVTVTERLLSI